MKKRHFASLCFAKHPFSIAYQLSLHLGVWMTNVLDCPFESGKPGLNPTNPGFPARIDSGALAWPAGVPEEYASRFDPTKSGSKIHEKLETGRQPVA